MESDGDTDKCIYTAEVKTSLYILDKKVKRGHSLNITKLAN